MGISQIVAGISVFLTGLLPMSCHKVASPTKAAPVKATAGATAGVTNSLLHDLGEVSLTNHYETCVQLGGGKDCTLMPRMVDSHNVALTVSLESRTPAGKTIDLTVAQVTTKTGRPMEIALGDYQLSFTPKLQ
jgi:hypothetical protein